MTLELDRSDAKEPTPLRSAGGDAETALILACVRAALPVRDKEQTPNLIPIAETIDWDHLISLSERQGVLPMVYQALRTLPAGDGSILPPEPISEQLWERFHGNVMRSMTLGMELVKIVGALQAAGVRVLPVKGVALAAQVYTDPTARQPGDLDLLIAPPDYGTTLAVLEDTGYTAHSPATMSQRQEAAWLHFRIERHFRQPQQRIDLDLHWQLFSQRILALDFDALWARGATVRLRDRTLRTLGVEDMLLYLCFHGSKHGWDALKWLVDVAMVLHGYADLDWVVVLARADALESRRMVLAGMALVREILGVELPDEIQRAISQDPALPTLVEAGQESLMMRLTPQRAPVHRGAADAGQPLATPQKPARSVRENLEARYRLAPMWTNMRLLRHQERGALRNTLHRFVSVMTPGAQEIRMASLPRPFFFVYYLLRLGRIVMNATSRARILRSKSPRRLPR
ncbi:MAG: nucleotidyltransferase family protein [Caldilineaceae bacterium]|nr:nucleotidyltransferase family protein [Caldilineaceae bacterium]